MMLGPVVRRFWRVVVWLRVGQHKLMSSRVEVSSESCARGITRGCGCHWFCLRVIVVYLRVVAVWLFCLRVVAVWLLQHRLLSCRGELMLNGLVGAYVVCE